jgi:ribosomal protein S20
MQDKFKQMKDDMQKLGQALQSGDLSGAQQVYSSLQKLLPSSSGSQTQNSRQSTLANDVNALGQALQSGDLSKAQDAYATLQKDMQATHKKHHHHHAAAASSASSDSTVNSAVQTDGSTSDSAVKSIDLRT